MGWGQGVTRISLGIRAPSQSTDIVLPSETLKNVALLVVGDQVHLPVTPQLRQVVSNVLFLKPLAPSMFENAMPMFAADCWN